MLYNVIIEEFVDVVLWQILKACLFEAGLIYKLLLKILYVLGG